MMMTSAWSTTPETTRQFSREGAALTFADEGAALGVADREDREDDPRLAQAGRELLVQLYLVADVVLDLRV